MTDQSQKSLQLSRRRFLQLSSIGLAASALGNVGFAPHAAGFNRRQTGTLRVAWGTPATLDTLSASADSEISFLNAIYDYLIDTNAASELIPRLAESWEMDEGMLSYTLKLRDGVTFHDGSPLTPEDVVWTFERLKSGGPTGDLYANVESVAVGDGNAVTFFLLQPNPDFLYDLSDNHALILKANAEFNGVDFNGTGPFVLDEYLPDDRAVLHANADYWGGAPGVETLEFVYFGDPQAAVSALRDGAVDVALRMDNATFLTLSGDSSFVAVDIPTNGHDLVRIRTDRAPGNDERVRQALRLATDRQAIFEAVQLGFGAVGQDTPIGPLFGDYYVQLDLPARDPAAARDLLAEAGYEDGLNMTLYVPNTGDRAVLAEVLKSQWADAGINVEIELQDEATYYADNGWLEVDLGITPWGSRPTPQFYLNQSLKTGAAWNESHFSDEELDMLIDLAGTTFDTEERKQAYEQIQRILVERGPLIVPYFFATLMVHSAGVSGIDLHPFAGRTNFNTAVVG